MRSTFKSSIILILFVLVLVGAPFWCEVHANDTSASEDDAQSTTKMPRIRPRARWSEDWSTIGDITPFLEPEAQFFESYLRPIKHIPLSDDEETYVSFGGEARVAYESYNDKDFGISATGNQDALQLRLAANIDLHFNEDWRVFTQIGYGKTSDRQGGRKTADDSNPNIWELFLDRGFQTSEDEQLVLRLGRQIIEAGGMLLNAGEGNNVRQVYDAARIGWLGGDRTKFEAFGGEFVDFADEAFEMSGTGEYLWGGAAGFRLDQSQIDLQTLYAGWSLKDRQFEQGGAGRHDEQRHTFMLRVSRPLVGMRQWGLDYSVAYQTGQYDNSAKGSTISAYAAYGEVKYAVFQEDDTPILGLRTAYFSGDDDPNDSTLGTFYDPLFGTPFFGYARDIQPFNLIYLQPNVGYRFGSTAVVTLSHGFYWRESTDDAFYGSPNGITARAGASNSAWIGQQTQLGVRYMVNNNLLVSGYLARFFAGTYLEDVGGKDRDYCHVGLHYLF